MEGLSAGSRTFDGFSAGVARGGADFPNPSRLADETGDLGQATSARRADAMGGGSSGGRSAEHNARSQSGGARFHVDADGSVTDTVGPRNAISIGRFPDYVDHARATGSRSFEVDADAWRSMSQDEQLLRNARFLDDAIMRDSEILLASPIHRAEEGTGFAFEVEYLTAAGYEVSSDGSRMVRAW
jgi:hypothetical protein